MELRKYIDFFLRWWWLMLLCMALSGASFYIRSSLQEPVYEAVSSILISQASGATSVDINSIQVSERLARTYVELLQSEAILSEAVSQLKCPFDVKTLAGMVQAALVRDTQLIRLRVEDTDPVRAAALCNLIPEIFSAYNNSTQSSRSDESKKSLAREIAVLEKQIMQMESRGAALPSDAEPEASNRQASFGSDLAHLRQSRANLVDSYEKQRLIEAQTQNNVFVVDRAQVPGLPIRPNIPRSVLLGVFLGFLLGGALIFCIACLDDSIKCAEQITDGLGLPLIGVTVLQQAQEAEAKPIAHTTPRAPITEAFRFIRSNILWTAVATPVRRILITSINAQEGKSFVAANLAVVFAQAGKSVALLDCDLHRPTQHRHFNRANRPGLSDSILQETFDPEHVLFTTDIPNLRLLTAGALPPQPAELLGSHKMGRFLDAIAVQQDFIVIDSPPIAALTDAAMLAKKVDGVVLVVEAGKTNASDVRHAKEQLERSGAHIIGVVLNKAPVNRSTYYHYHYSNYYNATYGEGGAREPDVFRQPVFYMRCLVKKLLYRRFSNEKEKLRHSERS